jgi:membrane protein YqaA with SNARE-associated domain
MGLATGGEHIFRPMLPSRVGHVAALRDIAGWCIRDVRLGIRAGDRLADHSGVLLAPLAAGARRRFLAPLATTMVGSALGGALLYVYAMKQPDRARSWLRRLPLVTDRQVAHASRSLRAHGVGALAIQPWSFVPLKVWAVVAAGEGFEPWVAIPIFAISRAVRMAAVATLASFAGNRLGRLLRDYSLFAAMAYVAVFFVSERRLVR